MSKINKFFDKIYVINRKCDTERLEKFDEQFKKFGIKYERLEATDKQEIDIETFQENEIYAYPNNEFHCLKYPCVCQGKGHMLSTSQIACAISHYRVYQDIV